MEILWKDGINPFISRDALAFCPNWNHTEAYAADVYKRLKREDEKRGAAGVRAELVVIERSFIAGAYGKKDLGDSDVVD